MKNKKHVCANGHPQIIHSEPRCPLCDENAARRIAEARVREVPFCITSAFRKEKSAAYSLALADVNCWLSGFVAAGGDYSPGTRETLKDLKNAIDRFFPQ